MRFIGGFHTMLPAPFLLSSCIADRRTQIEWQKRQRGRVTSVELFQLGGRPVPSRIRTLTDYYLARPRDPEASIIIAYIRYIHRLHLITLIEQKGLSTMLTCIALAKVLERSSLSIEGPSSSNQRKNNNKFHFYPKHQPPYSKITSGLLFETGIGNFH